jgi:hypothetical protein
VRIYLFQDEISCLQGEIPLRQSGAGDFLVLRLRKKGWCIVEFCGAEAGDLESFFKTAKLAEESTDNVEDIVTAKCLGLDEKIRAKCPRA